LLVKQVKFSNFRNLELDYNPGEGFNVILGQNSKGKSNFLDGLYMLSTAKSFKRFKIADNLDFNIESDFARLDCLLSADETLNLSVVFTKVADDVFQQKYMLNDKNVLRNKFEYKLKTILFTPESLEVMIGSPEDRRSELDEILSVFDKEYASTLKQYNYIVKSRNKLLYKVSIGKAGKIQLDFWNARLSELGSKIIMYRIKYLDEIKPSVNETAKSIFSAFGETKLKIKYIGSVSGVKIPKPDDFLGKLEEVYNKELILARTVIGPHRDDLEFNLGGRNLHIFGSRGEQRLATMIFKIATYEYLTKLYDTKAIFLLDDILSELDRGNKLKLLNYLHKTGAQVFLTLANGDDLPKKFLKQAKIYEL
jgi:DNA replication and repair protein RecF